VCVQYGFYYADIGASGRGISQITHMSHMHMHMYMHMHMCMHTCAHAHMCAHAICAHAHVTFRFMTRTACALVFLFARKWGIIIKLIYEI
jgi:hypothetical protein